MPLPIRAHLEISTEVAALLVKDTLGQLLDAAPFTDYTCPICDCHGRLGDPGNPAALVAWHYLPASLTRIRYAHASCSPSAILTINAYPAVRNASMAYACCALSPDHDPPAVLVIGCRSSLSAHTDTGDLTDRYAAVLLQRGMALRTSCCQRIPHVDGLAVLVEGPRVCVTAPGGETLFDGLLSSPPSWLAAVRSRGQVAVIAAAGLDLTEEPASTQQARDARPAAIQHAISAGHAVSGVARVTIIRRTRIGAGSYPEERRVA